MVIAINPNRVWVVWINGNIWIINLNPITWLSKTRVGIDVAIAQPATLNVAVGDCNGGAVVVPYLIAAIPEDTVGYVNVTRMRLLVRIAGQSISVFS